MELSEYGVLRSPTTVGSVAVGLALGAAGTIATALVRTTCGWAQWQPTQVRSLVVVAPLLLLVALGVGAAEELVFRGFFYTTVLSTSSVAIALGTTSAVFSLSHLLWDGREGIAQLPGLTLMGIVLVLARWSNGGSLGLAVGLHAGWVWGLACLDSSAIAVETDRAPRWATGGVRQPLAGALGIICLLLTGACLGCWLVIHRIPDVLI
ncbi:CAAX amino terminal protease family [Rubidibacter lacunae KORDI 51-2]|uniref:CAAX amino terminal protease family n=1 Tax=Rubidibacter lacunae KORDI 51-2 TaxID=582515 RepID=U5DIL0_9CHRO|nr:CPBP family intramembrane glutamic endopeptidase [Rubidibacter lacunae]ERN41506.1 CAAX amino terminal protease family [Rubidibacter lacunae KORDI 51-2]